MSTTETNTATTEASTSTAKSTEGKTPVKKAAPKKSAKKAAPKKVESKKADPKASPKKAAPKAEKSGASESGEYGMKKSKDLPWCAKKVEIFKILAKMGSGTAKEIAAKSSSLTARDVRHYCYHAMVSGLTTVEQSETLAYEFSLTKKGQAIDPVEEFKKQKEGKNSK